jgi:hypothetical protein
VLLISRTTSKTENIRKIDLLVNIRTSSLNHIGRTVASAMKGSDVVHAIQIVYNFTICISSAIGYEFCGNHRGDYDNHGRI